METQTRNFQDLVDKGLASTRTKHRPYNSLHEAYAVILEELEEFWNEVKKNSHHRSLTRLLAELVDTAVAIQRTAEDLNLIAKPD